MVGQEFFLFSWRLLLCDFLLAAYVLAITFFLLLARQARLGTTPSWQSHGIMHSSPTHAGAAMTVLKCGPTPCRLVEMSCCCAMFAARAGTN